MENLYNALDKLTGTSKGFEKFLTYLFIFAIIFVLVVFFVGITN
jgi:hypothetical protein